MSDKDKFLRALLQETVRAGVHLGHVPTLVIQDNRLNQVLVVSYPENISRDDEQGSSSLVFTTVTASVSLPYASLDETPWKLAVKTLSALNVEFYEDAQAIILERRASI